VRPDPGDTRLVGKGRRRPAAAGRWDSKPPPRWPGDRGQEREGAGTCATAGWRESQAERTASMSVLTLTAQAMQGDRERFPGRRLRQLPLQTNERRQARPHDAATVPGRAEGRPAACSTGSGTGAPWSFSRAFPLAATAGRDGQPLPTGWK
jgi:hypothetical protein